MRLTIPILAALLLTTPARATDPATLPAITDPKSLQLKPADLQWWTDAKFGMFIHWGLYAIPAQGEWYMNDQKIPAAEYRKLADQFNPQKYDPAQWAQIAKDAGMNYMVLTARHHDGFALWDSPASWQNFDAPHSATKRDLIAPYVKAVRDAGLRVGLYYSPMDWRFPGYFDPQGQPESAALLKKQAWGQVEELTTKYGPIDILWYDGGWLAMKGSDANAEPFWESNKLAALTRQFQPRILISPRSGWLGDFSINEGGNAVTGPIKYTPWEKALNLNQTAWGYTTRQNLMSKNQILTMLINTVTRGGNMLLNVGPDKDGQIPESHAARLKEVGDWLKQYGPSIYKTHPGPFPPVDNRYGSTYADKTIYLHILNWSPPARGRRAGTAPATTPAPEALTLPPISQRITAIKSLTGGTPTFAQTVQSIIITLPRENHDPLDTIISLECDAPITPQLP